MSRFVPIPNLPDVYRADLAQLADQLSAVVVEMRPELAVSIWRELPCGREIVRTATFDGESRSATARVENVARRPLQVIIDRLADLILTVAAPTECP